ncbi:cholesterol 24-hydroxylase-like [Ylistrum balloti]|uniref:cholesterol 24-hydroxylase-like n=1 Tax=Ylistrum balloti TaxID=509963 RepID=UPI002905F556|nr:cholesterol 24-hydroxylase-like [Ylistrum balloti]
MSLLLMDVFGIVLAILISVFVSAAWYVHRQHQKYDHLPGPKRDSFWSGHIPSISKTIAAGGIIDDYFLEVSKTHGLIFRICLWHQVLVIVLDPEYIKDVLVSGKHQKSKRLYSRLVNLFGVRFIGLGIESQIDRKMWIIQRMHLDNWFKPHYLRKFASDFNEYSDRFIEHMETQADGKTEIHMLHSFNKLSMHLLYKVAFSVDMGPLSEEDHPFVKKFKTVLSGFAAQLEDPFVAVNPFKWRFRRDVLDALRYIRQTANQELIDRRVAKDKGGYFPEDLLEYIMKLKEKYPSIVTDEILLDNYVTFIIAGQETSANAMSFIVFLLGRNPECYKKLQREIDENIGTMSVITLNELEKLPYLDMVFKETLRLYPIAKASYRETKNDYSLGDHVIPAGTDMLVSFYGASRSERNVKNPLTFSPERFLSDSPEEVNKYVSTPFSAGPHTCIGKKFAEIQVKITIAKIIQKFDFDLKPGQSSEIIDHLTIQLKDGAVCFFRHRKLQ